MAGKHLSLLVHFVWSTGGREPWITAEWNHRLFGFIGGVLRHDGVKLIGAGGMSVGARLDCFDNVPRPNGRGY